MPTTARVKPDRRRSNRLTRRLTFVLTTLVAASLLVLGALATYTHLRTLTDGFDQRLMTVARLAALQLNGDTVQAVVAAPDEESAEYQALAERLAAVRVSEGIDYAYIAVLSPGGTGVVMVDGSEEPSSPGTDYGADPGLDALYAEKSVQLDELMNDPTSGWVKTAYAPIIDSNGNVVAALGIDMSAAALRTAYLRGISMLVAAGLATALVSMAVAARVANGIASRVLPLSARAERLAEGDLATASGELAAGKVRDEVDTLGNSLRAMHSSLIDIVRELRENSSQVIAAAGQLSAAIGTVSTLAGQVDQSMDQVATGTTDQAQNASEAATFLLSVSSSLGNLADGAGEQAAVVSDAATQAGEIAQVTEQVVTRAEEASAAAHETTVAAQTGGTAVSNTISAVTRIAEAVNNAAASMEKLNGQAMRIGEISTTIRELADQSNLLALNAAIEAARAGEHGRGFAVVADEVRNLARSSGTSADQIRGILTGISETVGETLTGMQSALREIDGGMEKAGQAGQALEHIVEQATVTQEQVDAVASDSRRTAERARAIADSAERASQAVLTSVSAVNAVAADSQRVDDAVHSVAAISEETAALADSTRKQMRDVARTLTEVSEALTSLSTVAGDLETVIARFRL